MARRPVEPASPRCDAPKITTVKVETAVRLVTLESPTVSLRAAKDAFSRQRGGNGRFVQNDVVESPEPRVCKVCLRTSKEVVFDSRLTCRGCIAKQAAKRRDATAPLGTIYFVQIENEDGFVKVGFTGSIVKRFPNGYFTDNPYSLKILSLSIGVASEEFELHRHLRRSSHLRGEWYYPTREVLNAASRSNREGQIAFAVDEFRRMYG